MASIDEHTSGGAGSILSNLLTGKENEIFDAPKQAKSQPSQTQQAYIVPAIATTLVQDLTKFSNEQLAEKLPIIDINFTCKICRTKKSCLNDLMEHLQSGACQNSEKRPRGRPRKHAKLETNQKPPPKPKVKKEKETVPILTGTPGRRATRMSTGAIKRRNIAQMLGLNRRSDSEGSDDEDDTLKEEVGNDPESSNENTATVLSMEDVLSAVQRAGIEAGGDATLIMEVEDIATDSQPITEEITADFAPDGHAGAGDAAPADVDIQCMPAPADEDPSETSIEKVAFSNSKRKQVLSAGLTKVSLIPQTVMDIEEAQADGQNAKPIVTINTDGRGSIVIPTSTNSGEVKQVVIPHSLLLEALKEHQKKESSSSDKTVVLVNEVSNGQEATAIGDDVATEVVEKEEFDLKQEQQEQDRDPDYGDKRTDKCIVSKKKKPSGHLGTRDRKWRYHRPRRNCKIRCSVCLVRYFGTQTELDIHMDAHVLKSLHKDDINNMVDAKGKKATLCKLRDLFKCPKCVFQANSWSRMIRHLVSHDVYKEKLKNKQCVQNIMGQFPCPVCNKMFERKWNLVSHVSKVHEKAGKTCSICGKVFEKVDDKTFKRHWEICRNVTLSCDQCDYTTPVSANLRKHKRIHTDEAFVCGVCGKKFCTKQRQLNHMLKHETDRRRYRCEMCEKLFLTVDALKKHVTRLHLSHDYLFECAQCSYTTKIRTDLTKHLKYVHNKKYKCPQEDCDFMTNSERSMLQHDEYHLPDRVHPCPYSNCYFRGVTVGHVTEHCNSLHNENSKYQCPVCQKVFKKKTHLLRHLVTHTGDKPYSCGECHMTFYSHSTYYRHRSKTGHDRGRRGVVSVPQNIIITYVQDGKEDYSIDFKAKSRLPQGSGNVENVALDAVQKQQEAYMAEAEAGAGAGATADVMTAIENMESEQNIQLEAGKQEDVVFIETTETQFLEEINIAELTNGQQVINGAPDSAEVIQQLNVDVLSESSVNMLNQVSLQVAGGGDLTQEQLLENIITVPEGPAGQQYTYILSTQEAENMISSGQLKVGVPPAAEMEIQEGLATTEQNAYAQQNVYAEEPQVSQMETVVEVTPPGGGGQQYAILLVPSAGDEPEAALSMLQLQSS